MKVTLKSTSEIKDIIKNGQNVSIDDKSEYFANNYGGTTLEPTEIFIYGSGPNKEYSFRINLESGGSLYNYHIPRSWIASYDLEEQIGKYICRTCGFTVSPESNYQFEIEKIYNRDEDKYKRVTWYDVMDGSLKDDGTVCPLCHSRNTMDTIN